MDFSLNGFLSGVDDSLQYAGLGGTDGVLNSFLQYKTEADKTKAAAEATAQAQKYEQVTQKAASTTAKTMPFSNTQMLIGGGILLGAVLLFKR